MTSMIKTNVFSDFTDFQVPHGGRVVAAGVLFGPVGSPESNGIGGVVERSAVRHGQWEIGGIGL